MTELSTSKEEMIYHCKMQTMITGLSITSTDKDIHATSWKLEASITTRMIIRSDPAMWLFTRGKLAVWLITKGDPTMWLITQNELIVWLTILVTQPFG